MVLTTTTCITIINNSTVCSPAIRAVDRGDTPLPRRPPAQKTVVVVAFAVAVVVAVVAAVVAVVAAVVAVVAVAVVAVVLTRTNRHHLVRVDGTGAAQALIPLEWKNASRNKQNLIPGTVMYPCEGNSTPSVVRPIYSRDETR